MAESIEDFKHLQYGCVAVEAVRCYISGDESTPLGAWEYATKHQKLTDSGQKKVCPKDAFLGLCSAGLIKGIPKGDYTDSIENKEYAVKAVACLVSNPGLVEDKNELWVRVIDKPTAKNGQMDVVLSLWIEGFIDRNSG